MRKDKKKKAKGIKPSEYSKVTEGMVQELNELYEYYEPGELRRSLTIIILELTMIQQDPRLDFPIVIGRIQAMIEFFDKCQELQKKKN